MVRARISWVALGFGVGEEEGICMMERVTKIKT